jgi:hypothetical protein
MPNVRICAHECHARRCQVHHLRHAAALRVYDSWCMTHRGRRISSRSRPVLHAASWSTSHHRLCRCRACLWCGSCWARARTCLHGSRASPLHERANVHHSMPRQDGPPHGSGGLQHGAELDAERSQGHSCTRHRRGRGHKVTVPQDVKLFLIVKQQVDRASRAQHGLTSARAQERRVRHAVSTSDA